MNPYLLKKMASKTRFNSTHQSLLTTWHVSWIEFLLNLQYFFFCRKLISCSFKIELVLWIFESSFGRICKLISYYKRVVNEKKSSCFKLLNSLKRWNDNKLKWAVSITIRQVTPPILYPVNYLSIVIYRATLLMTSFDQCDKQIMVGG